MQQQFGVKTNLVRYMKAIDITGQRFGRLTAIEFSHKEGRRHYWVFMCDCGTKKAILKASVMNNRTTSCGCYNREVVSKNQAKDLSNQRFGRLVAIEATGKDKHGVIIWKCQCDCGNTRVVRSRNLLSGNTKSCGCYSSEVASKTATKDLKNQRFGRLVAIEHTKKRDDIRSRSLMWKCQCDCGNTCEVLTHLLLSGNTVSCGCYGREASSKRARKDISNQRFHMLVAIEPAGKNKYGVVMWKCQCDCGNTSVVRGTALRTEATKSCGCWSKTKKAGRKAKNKHK